MSTAPGAQCCPEPALTPSDPPRGDLRQDHPLVPPSPVGTQPTPVSVEDDWGRVQDADISVHERPHVLKEKGTFRTSKRSTIIAAHRRSQFASIAFATLPVPDQLATYVCIAGPVKRVARCVEGVLRDEARRCRTAQRIRDLIPPLFRSQDTVIKARTPDPATMTALNVVGSCVSARASTINIAIADNRTAAATGDKRVLPTPIDGPIFRRCWAIGQHFRREARKRADRVDQVTLLACAASHGHARSHVCKCNGNDSRKNESHDNQQNPHMWCTATTRHKVHHIKSRALMSTTSSPSACYIIRPRHTTVRGMRAGNRLTVRGWSSSHRSNACSIQPRRLP